jgi:hypothetical protein
MKETTVTLTGVVDTFLVLLIGVGPKIALVPFLQITAPLPVEGRARVRRKMLVTAATASPGHARRDGEAPALSRRSAKPAQYRTIRLRLMLRQSWVPILVLLIGALLLAACVVFAAMQ